MQVFLIIWLKKKLCAKIHFTDNGLYQRACYAKLIVCKRVYNRLLIEAKIIIN